MTFPNIRMRRLRQSAAIRRLVRETHLSVDDLIMPLFIRHGEKQKVAIDSMPGQYQFSVDMLADEIKEIVSLNIPAVLLFGIPAEKDEVGSSGYDVHGIIPTAVKEIKRLAPELLVITDVCFCEYTSHGHCGALTTAGDDVDNDATLPLLVKQATSHVAAGADIIAPSGMMDGMVTALRTGLDDAGYLDTPILSYAVKFASAMYGPFRDAAEGAPQFGDRQTYQMDIANADEAMREAELDLQEGADMLMVKPAHTYLDIICRVKMAYPEIPLAAYHVSGEFSMIKAAANNGWIDEVRAAHEVLLSIKRAGADMIITYFAKQMAEYLQ